jgi:hypothetical protein
MSQQQKIEQFIERKSMQYPKLDLLAQSDEKHLTRFL